MTRASGDDDNGGLGVAAEVIDVEIAAPKVEQSDEPSSTESAADTAAVATPEQKAEIEQTDLQKGVPTTTEEADQRVSPTAEKKPTEEEKVAAVETNASEAHTAAEDLTRKTLDVKVPEADRVKATDRGTGKTPDAQTKDWHRRISLEIREKQKYPPGNKTKGGSVRVTFTINRVGTVLSADVTESSGDEDYDRAAVDMIRRTKFPKPPAKLTDDEFLLSIVVNFPPAKKA
uniref:cell envelope integrity protein TolA n=1 Tax=Bradyrhizobium sp. (strain ORS 278) TaxID=114615 RepID=UPI001FCB8C6F|nr:TonB family protein [Bradyrhizobium sp. ORS 278]